MVLKNQEPQVTAKRETAPGDGWTRVFPPPKARISDAYAASEPLWRKLLLVLAAIGFGGIAWAMLAYAVRVPVGQRAPLEPTRADDRAREAEALLRRRGMETEPFKRAEEEKARRLREIEARRNAGAGKAP